MDSVNEICEQLRDQGRRVTPQRRAIIEVLLDSDAHPTAEQVLKRARRELPSISPATVYNTLHELVEMGFLLELDLGVGLAERRYEVADAEHDHLVCLECGRMENVPLCSEVLPLPEEHTHGFEIVDRRVTYLGYCPDCASQQ